MVLNSYAKLNLYLEVLGKRKDSYHNIRTIFERIDLCDKIILKPRRDKKIKVISKGKISIPQDSSNLAYRSAKLLQDSFNIEKGVDIRITKHIPVASGLGGGSSNAATVLLGLNKLWGLQLAKKTLVSLARRLGSDAPFFIYNCPFAFGQGRGDRIRPLYFLNTLRLWHILVVPKIRVPTELIYKEWDRGVKTFKLTRPRYNVKILLQRLKDEPSLVGEALYNSLQEVTFRIRPSTRYIQRELSDLGLKTILMSGSGAAIFALVSSRKEAIALYNRMKRKKRPWQVFIARTF